MIKIGGSILCSLADMMMMMMIKNVIKILQIIALIKKWLQKTYSAY